MCFFDKMKKSLVIVLLPLFMIFLLGPTEIYYSNITDFTFLYKDFVGIMLMLFVMVLIVSLAVVSLLPNKTFEFIVSLITVMTIVSYVQNMFLNTSIATKDGTMMDWGSMKSTIVVNTVIWIVLIVLFIYLFYIKKWMKISRVRLCNYCSAFLLLIQLVAFISIVVNIEVSGDNNNMYILDASSQFDVAKDNNIIVLCLDSADSSTLRRIYDQEPDRYEYLNDFTLYTNYDSGYCPTFPSVTHLLTGIDPDGKGTQLEYNENAWSSERAAAFFGKLNSNGYDVHIYASMQKYVLGNIELLSDKVDNVEYTTPYIDRNNRLLAIMLEKMTLYRYAPYILKPTLEVDMDHFVEATKYSEDEFEESTYAEYEAIRGNGLAVDNTMENVFIYQHIKGMHKPYDISETGEYIWEEDYNKEDAYRGVMLYVEEYIKALKDAGVYDSSTLIVIADHSQEYHAPEMSLLLIKQANETHDMMQYCNAPVCSDDFQATILSLIGEDYSDYGTSIYDWTESDSRERWNYYRYKGLFGFKYNGDNEEMHREYEEGYDYQCDNVEW